ncbi:hypothetical protein N9R65_02990 [Opitutales bacterium]|nr:hypothetical protein [Opitutales bacterium]MDB2681508.1 hypothetical protein [Opitutales bacterium]
MRYAALILFYDCDRFILKAIENCAPHVEKIYISYSPYPWSYNPEAREKFRNPSDPKLIQQSKYLDKIEFVEGDWPTEEAQRNEVLDKAKVEGFDYLIIQDADEFYLPEEFQKNLQQIEENPDYSYYRNPWYLFWKSTRHIIICRYSYIMRGGKVEKSLSNTPIGYNMAFALNLNKEVRFSRCRRPTHLDDFYVLDGLCYHLSYVMSDDQVERKMQTYGHTNQINHCRWLRYKWYGWRESTNNIHPFNPVMWKSAQRFTGALPRELVDFEDPSHSSRSLGWSVRLLEYVVDLELILKNHAIRTLLWIRSHVIKK